jgi:hypothetical protein
MTTLEKRLAEALVNILSSGRWDDAGNFVIDCEDWDGEGDPPDTTDPKCLRDANELLNEIRLEVRK